MSPPSSARNPHPGERRLFCPLARFMTGSVRARRPGGRARRGSTRARPTHPTRPETSDAAPRRAAAHRDGRVRSRHDYRHLLRPFREFEIGCHLATSLAVKKSDRATNDHHTTVNRVDFDRRDDVGARAEPRVVSSSARTASHETTTARGTCRTGTGSTDGRRARDHSGAANRPPASHRTAPRVVADGGISRAAAPSNAGSMAPERARDGRRCLQKTSGKRTYSAFGVVTASSRCSRLDDVWDWASWADGELGHRIARGDVRCRRHA